MKFSKIIIIFFLLGIAACSSSLSDKEAVQLATNKHIQKELKRLKEYAPQATWRGLALKVQSSEVLSNDGVNAKVKLVMKKKDDPGKGSFPKPYSIEVEVTKPE
jgi:hypothetical protein